jgi:hypothetical protein
MGSSSHDPKSSGAGEVPSAEPSKAQTALYEVLDHFSESLATVQTVSNALQAAQNNPGTHRGEGPYEGADKRQPGKLGQRKCQDE